MNGFRIVIALSFSGIFAWGTLNFSGVEKGERPRYRSCVGGWLLPTFVATLLGLNLVFFSWDGMNQLTDTWIFGVLLHVSLYFLLLTLALPLLRRSIRAGACAMLWLVPNYLYMTYHTNLFLPPHWIVTLPWRWMGGLTSLWLAGMWTVLGWKIVAHLRFRRWLLREAELVADPEVLSVWQAEVERARVKKPKFRLVTSPQAVTPMSIGLFERSTRVVLPRRHYTPEELKLIFRHELVHVGRADAWNKFFLVFCTAMCWFNPLMWLAMRRSSEDLELSCDEAVLTGLGEEERRRYAQLILRTAGDSRGFTTCLSASASALRYRLKSIMKSGRKLPGALLVGTVFFVLFMTCGQVGLAYEAGTGESAIYHGNSRQGVLEQVRQSDGGLPETMLVCRDEDALGDYLASLSLSEMSGSCRTFYGVGGEQIVLLYNTREKDVLSVVLWDDYIKVEPLGEDGAPAYYYYVSGGLDWEKLHRLLEPEVV